MSGFKLTNDRYIWWLDIYPIYVKSKVTVYEYRLQKSLCQFRHKFSDYIKYKKFDDYRFDDYRTQKEYNYLTFLIKSKKGKHSKKIALIWQEYKNGIYRIWTEYIDAKHEILKGIYRVDFQCRWKRGFCNFTKNYTVEVLANSEQDAINKICSRYDDVYKICKVENLI